eukprot:scaffold463_cov351-Prasinococcus_capsulatus_cf.AAC.2
MLQLVEAPPPKVLLQAHIQLVHAYGGLHGLKDGLLVRVARGLRLGEIHLRHKLRDRVIVAEHRSAEVLLLRVRQEHLEAHRVARTARLQV